MSSPLRGTPGIRSTTGHTGGLRGAIRPWGQAAGLVSALAAGVALAEDPKPQPENTPEGQYVLPTVQVQENAESYHTEESSLTRLPAALVDTPQTVTVVPRKVMEEQQATTVREALRNVSGITAAAGEGGRQGDTFILRGFSAQTDVARDGVRDLGWFTRDTFNLDGVEVYLGPSSVLFGRGSTGGAINLVTKKPKGRDFQNLRLTGGTAPSGRVEADINQVLSERLQVRVSAVGQLASVAGRDLVQQNRAGVAPSARLELGANTSLDVDYFYQRENSVPDYGQPYFNGSPVSRSFGVARDVFYGVKDSDTEKVNVHIGTGRLQHDFGGALLTNTLRLGRVDRFARPTAPRGLTPASAPTAIGRQRFETETDNTYLANQTDVRSEFETGFAKHTVNAGLELAREWRAQHRDNLNAVGLTTGPNLPADLFNPEPSPDLSPVESVFQSATDTQQWTAAVYVADQVALSKYVEVLGSARFDVFSTHYTTESATALTRMKSKDRFLNWRGGLVFHPVEKTSLYAMYGTSSNPSAETGVIATGTASLEPERNTTFEMGAKADLLEERLGLNASVFRTDKTNARVPNTDPEGPPVVLGGAQRVQGFNVGVVGTVTKRWQVFANYTQLDSEIREHSNPYLVGQALPNTPRRSFTLWTTCGVTEHFSLGGGAVFQDVTTVNNPTSEAQTLNKIPNFWRFDAVASYAWSRVELQLNLRNLSNALYYEQSSGAQAVPAEARSATLTGAVRF